MTMQSQSFISKTHAALATTPIIKLLTTTDAVILERIAMGAGSTRWYYCPDKSRFEAIVAQLSPGSVTSFYFDRRIQSALYSLDVKLGVERIVAETGEGIVGILSEDGLHIAAEIVNDAHEIEEALSTATCASRVFYGSFPARDNDGIRAVTVVLPDVDGVVRPHPH